MYESFQSILYLDQFATACNGVTIFEPIAAAKNPCLTNITSVNMTIIVLYLFNNKS